MLVTARKPRPLEDLLRATSGSLRSGHIPDPFGGLLLSTVDLYLASLVNLSITSEEQSGWVEPLAEEERVRKRGVLSG